MAQIIQAQALIPLNLHVSGLPGAGLNIEAVSFGQGSNVFSFNAAPIAAPEYAQTPPNKVQSFESDTSEDVNVAADLINFIQPTTPPEGCPNHAPEAYLIGDAPRMIYVKSFLTEDERQHILAKTENQYTPAYVYKPGSDTPDTDSTFRKSETAVVERDAVIQCIEYRAKHMQQNLKWTNMALEPLTVQRYQKGGFFDYHLDGFQGKSLPNRKSTFNVWLDGNCTGGGTHFPSIPRYEDPSLCTYLDCNMPADNGTVFKPIAGNAVFWESISDDGHVYLETVHAGLPVEEGTKIGLNIWTWEFAPGDPRSHSLDSNAAEVPCSSCS